MLSKVLSAAFSHQHSSFANVKLSQRMSSNHPVHSQQLSLKSLLFTRLLGQSIRTNVRSPALIYATGHQVYSFLELISLLNEPAPRPVYVLQLLFDRFFPTRKDFHSDELILSLSTQSNSSQPHSLLSSTVYSLLSLSVCFYP
jgi:hypothetical protein